MNKTIIISLSTLLLLFTLSAQGQRSYIRSKIRHNIEKDMEKKHAEPQRERGKKALRDNAYENDTRYPAPENRVKATLSMETKTFKSNGQLKNTMTSKIVFGPTGECMIMNEGKTNETRMLFDYEGAANYMVNVKEKTAMKMPMINFAKMAERMSKNQPKLEGNEGKWQKTTEKKTINGYVCRKYIYTDNEGNRMDVWTTQDISIDLSDNHLFGSSIKDFSSQVSVNTPVNENIPKGLMVRNIYYEKKSQTPSMQTDITQFDESSDPLYFDLSAYEINDVLDKL